ncbi:hypothetical protein MCOR19_004213 [Pyricularia oryzae]|uniref:Uncharacterized protein n=1 Tax=Pyricularia oryzae TaxID=318829 RepID=A0A4P7NVG3_PYROR|nr:hypothetical protein MCOR01_009335 [Pyricularia oryzae]KAI6259475.1 hypothetical protein MCOR19_004213 [Pyricularia oryzae]KAI6415938.1 hypothetical protein MCOR20_001314 [Pyricularia oryzae]KAI6425475.1 hypothetical protein MCOR24_003080 [Pyricularia oryzae]KAI6452379.1 hypothetical protein MCOR17_009540 [Pyricularia oryzae]
MKLTTILTLAVSLALTTATKAASLKESGIKPATSKDQVLNVVDHSEKQQNERRGEFKERVKEAFSTKKTSWPNKFGRSCGQGKGWCGMTGYCIIVTNGRRYCIYGRHWAPEECQD